MKLEDQVTSLELSKRLKKLGVKQESLFCWAKTVQATVENNQYVKNNIWEVCLLDNKPEYYIENKKDLYFVVGYDNDDGEVSEIYPAFTVAELGEMLPARLQLTKEMAKKLIFDLAPRYQRKVDESTIEGLDTFPYDQLTFHLVTDFIASGDKNVYYTQDYGFPWMLNNSTDNWDKNEANAKAKMLIYLLENKLTELPK